VKKLIWQLAAESYCDWPKAQKLYAHALRRLLNAAAQFDEDPGHAKMTANSALQEFEKFAKGPTVSQLIANLRDEL
jgi:hypothetical protein